jgi:hypothetical protein
MYELWLHMVDADSDLLYLGAMDAGLDGMCEGWELVATLLYPCHRTLPRESS